MMSVRPVLIMAGGTGGHVFPALAVADVLRQQGVPVVWLGTRRGIEARLVPEAGYPVQWIKVRQVRGKSLMTRLLSPFNILYACLQSLKVLFRIKPCAVLGMGGFASGPGGLVAWLLRKPLLIHEQNAVPGMTNRLLARIARKVMVAFPHAFDSETTHVGNPVRQSILNLPAPEERFRDRDESMRILVVGGSLGAAHLNRVVPQAVSMMTGDQRPQIIHQTGNTNLDECIAEYQRADVEADVRAFIEDMDQAYAWADLVICRSGAMTVFELAAAGVGSVLVPYPHAVDDHQSVNAAYLQDAGAAIRVAQQELDAERLNGLLERMQDDRGQLLEMARRARELAMPNSADDVARACMQLGGIA